MTGRVPDAAAAKQAFLNLADAEGARIPFYARLCRVIAAHPELHELLLVAPSNERLPVLVLDAVHDLVLRRPELPLARWYPSVTGASPPEDDPTGPLLDAVRAHRDELVHLLRTRQVQTNEVNRSCAWWWGLTALTRDDRRPLHLVEVGASGGLNLLLDAYAHRFRSTLDGDEVVGGDPMSGVRLDCEVRAELPDHLRAALPEVVGRVGLDRRPVDLADADDRRWLRACVWPEQRRRDERLTAALEMAARRPPRVVQGDLVADLAPLLAEAAPGAHVVVLSSWTLFFSEPDRRREFAQVLDASSGPIRRAGGRLTLLSLEDGRVLPWLEPPPLPPDADADHVHASLLVATSFDGDGLQATALARCQAHMNWCEPLAGPAER